MTEAAELEKTGELTLEETQEVADKAKGKLLKQGVSGNLCRIEVLGGKGREPGSLGMKIGCTKLQLRILRVVL